MLNGYLLYTIDATNTTVRVKKIQGEILRILRLSKNLSQRQLADLAGTDQPTISKLERGELFGKPYLWLKIAQVLGVPYSYLTGGDND